MLEKIQLLRNTGQFDNVSSGGQLPFSKLTLVYAENGRGKTTLSNILRSLGSGATDIISERKRLGASHPPHIIISALQNTATQSFKFENGSWSGQIPEIAVFDDNFVAQNVCSGIAIETGHRQNLHELILGAQGVALNAALQGHIANIELHNRELKSKGDAIPASARGVLTVDTFCAIKPVQDVDAKIQLAERNLAAAKAADAIKIQGDFLPIELPEFDVDSINLLLNKDLPNLQASAAAHVQAHLAKLGKEANSWVADGMQKIPAASAGKESNSCPFCAQDLSGSTLIADYEIYFSEAYTNLKSEITDMGKAVAGTHGGDVPTAFERSVRIVIEQRDFWQKFIEIPQFEIDTAEVSRRWKAAREGVLAILRSKLAAPLEAVSLSEDTLNLISAYHLQREAVTAASKSIVVLNPQIAIVREKSASANVATLAADLAKLTMVKVRHTPPVSDKCQAYTDEKNAKKATETNRDAARAALDTYRTSIFAAYETAINAYLTKFNAGFRLGSVSSLNTRAGSSCTYNVLINNVSVPISADSGPSFKNTLSAGDRNTLALAFFFASLEQDGGLAQKIVVIDDPMTSLDEHRSLTTVQEIKRLATRVAQVVVLSHSKAFLCAMWDGVAANLKTALRINRHGSSSVLSTWDVHQDCITEHDRRHAQISDYIVSSNPANERVVATALRPTLEAFFRVAYPADFPPGTLLGRFHTVCLQRLTTGNPILSANDATELREILDYANRFHHDTNPAWATELINDQELLNFCQRTLDFLKRP